jgi:hypothetical protein
MASSDAPGWKKYVNAFLAAELSTLTRYYDRLIQWLPREDDSGMLLAAMDAPIKQTVGRDEPFPDLSSENEQRTAILVNGAFNHDFDIQGLLVQLKSKLSRTSRVVAVLYNPYLRWLYNLANRFGVRKGELPSTFLTRVDLQNIVKVSGYEIVRHRLAVYFPWKWLGLGDVINRVLPLIPLVRWFSLTSIVVLRPLAAAISARLAAAEDDVGWPHPHQDARDKEQAGSVSRSAGLQSNRFNNPESEWEHRAYD